MVKLDTRIYYEDEYGGELDTDSSWAKGHEDRLIYYQSTADMYEVYISTESHDHKNLYFEQDGYIMNGCYSDWYSRHTRFYY